MESLELRKILAKGKVQQVGSDTSVALVLKPIKGEVDSVTSVTIDNTENTLEIISVKGTTTNTDTYAFATLTTFAKLVNAIKATRRFDVKALDVLLGDATTSKMVDGAVTVSSDGIYRIKNDTSATNSFTTRFTFDRNLVDSIRKTHRIHLQEISTLINDTDLAPVITAKVYQEDKQGNVTEIFSASIVDNTATVLNWADGEGFITSDDGKDLIVKVSAVALTDDTGNYLTAVAIIE